jgi:hypothetical protein
MNEQILVYLLIVILIATGAAIVFWARRIYEFYGHAGLTRSSISPLVYLFNIRCCSVGLIALAMFLLWQQISN